MKILQPAPWPARAAIAIVSIIVTGCGGGGGSGSAGAGSPTILQISAQGLSPLLWNGAASPPVCGTGIFANGAITFTFGGPVAPASIPANGQAIGSINIIATASGVPAIGTFTVEDDPAHAAGNQRRVVFRPSPPGDPLTPCSAGLATAQTYQIFVPRGGSSPQVLNVAHAPITTEATTCFSTCGCPDPGACGSTYADPAPGPPFVIDTVPATADPAPASIATCAIVDHSVTIRVSEALDPSSVDLANVRVVHVATGAQVPGHLVFHQAGTIPSEPAFLSRIDYVAWAPLTAGATFEILLGPGVRDLAGHPIQTSQTNPAAHLFFATTPETATPQAPIVETFDTNAGLGDLTGPIRWAGDGVLQAEFPVDLTGTGADGSFIPAAGLVLLDTNELVNGVSRKGLWNFTNVTIAQPATVRIIGPYLAHFRCTGSFTLNGIIQALPGQITPPTASTPAYDKGAQTGQQQNGLGVDCEANGGVGNAGGGAGGTGSGITPSPGSPPFFQCSVRTLFGERGYGPTIDGLPNGGNVPNPLYAGGQGGISGCFPSLAPCTPVLTDLGGLGGAGGTAGRIGEPGAPRFGAMCAVNTFVTQPVAQPSPIASAMIPPIAIQSAGSGGGGGGDHLSPMGTPPNNDGQGGGAGGGGGGLRISCVGAYAQGVTGQINASGMNGGNASNSCGAGGSGSGGEVWIQTFSTVTIAAASVINVTGPARLFPSAGLIGCSNQASGGGGAGLVQIEAGQGPAPTPSFNLVPAPTPTAGAVFSAPPFQYAQSVQAQARSKFRHAGVNVPDYTSAVEVFNIGPTPGANLQIRYEGAFEALDSMPQNPVADPSTIKSTASGGGPITAANLDELDGYPLIRFVVSVSYPPPPATPINAILPSVDSITINLSGVPASCP